MAAGQGIAALRELEAASSNGQRGQRFLASDRPTVADIACFPYVALAPDGGVSLDPLSAAIRRWSRAIRASMGFIEMPGIHRLHDSSPSRNRTRARPDVAGYLLKNCAAVIVDDGNGPSIRRNVDVLTDGAAIKAIGAGLDNGNCRRYRRPGRRPAGSSIRASSTPIITSSSASCATAPSWTGRSCR